MLFLAGTIFVVAALANSSPAVLLIGTGLIAFVATSASLSRVWTRASLVTGWQSAFVRLPAVVGFPVWWLLYLLVKFAESQATD